MVFFFFIQKFFSVALAVTNITGVFAAGFEAQFKSLGDGKDVAFLKVRNRLLNVSCKQSKITCPIRSAILVHSRGSFRKALNALPLRMTFLCLAVSAVDQDHDTCHRRLAGLVPVRHLLSSLAALVQLDRLRTHSKLPSHVCLLERDGYRTRHEHPLPSHVFYPKSSHELRAEDWDKRYLWTRHFVSPSSRKTRTLGFMYCLLNCSSVLYRTFHEGNIELNYALGNHAVDFDGKLSSSPTTASVH